MNAINLDDQNFNELALGEKPSMVNFSADWCGTCKAVAPAFEQLVSESDASVLIGKLDVDQNPVTANRYGVRSIPTFLFFKNGELVDRVVGAVPKSVLENKIDFIK